MPSSMPVPVRALLRVGLVGWKVMAKGKDKENGRKKEGVSVSSGRTYTTGPKLSAGRTRK